MDKIIEQKKGLKKKHIPFIIGGALLVLLFGWMLFGDHSSKMRIDTKNIIISKVEQGSFNDYIRINGQVQPATVVHVSALESGIVDYKPVKEGAMVKRGDVILVLRNPNLAQETLNSESQLAERQNMLRDTEINMEKDKLSMQQSKLSAITDANRTRRAYEQIKTLYDEGLSSREEYLRAKEDYELAQSQLDLLIERLHQDSLYRSVQLAKMQESLNNMQENLTLVRQRADNLKVKATYDGQLGSFSAELGQNIGAGTLIGQINVLGEYKITVNIDERYIDRITAGLPGTFERQGVEYAVAVSTVYPEVRNGQFRADLTFSDEVPENIRVGQTYYINLELGEPTPAVLIPRGSFFGVTGGKWLFVVSPDGSEAVRREIRIGRQNPQYYEVLEGLSPGEYVVISGYDSFGDSEKLMLK